jgi:hypothetical protein
VCVCPARKIKHLLLKKCACVCVCVRVCVCVSCQDDQATPSQEVHAELSERPDVADTASQHLGIQVPHWGAALDVTKMALEETAEKERALNSKLARAEKRRVDAFLANLLERKTLLEEVENDVNNKHRLREQVLADEVDANFAASQQTASNI